MKKQDRAHGSYENRSISIIMDKKEGSINFDFSLFGFIVNVDFTD